MLIEPKTTMRSLTAIFYFEEDVYGAECPEVGTASQGETIEEALINLKEATELYLEEFPRDETAHCFFKNILNQAGITVEEFFENL